MKKAILFGATGLIGSQLLQDLLHSSEYEQVTVVARRKTDLSHSKLKHLVGDFHSLPKLKGELVGQDVFLTLGTTRAKTPDQKEYYQIDHDYPVLAAKLSKENGASAVFLVTAVGANAKSSAFYIRTKGEVERDVIALNFPHTHIFRPSMIMGNRAEHRPLEKIFVPVFSCINPVLIGGLSRYRGIDGKDIASAMIRAAQTPSEKVKIYHWEEMARLNRA